MGGKEGSRGYLYQAFASVLEAMCQKNWDKIYIEFDSGNDKIDIALEENNKIFKSVQVKSSINIFCKSSLKKWLEDLIFDEVGANEFELFLIGQCDKSATTFINAIYKFQDDKLDNTANKSLEGFDISIIKDKKISFKCIPFHIETLEQMVRDSLHKYISYKGQIMTYDQISFIASATVNDQMISSTHGKGIDRKTFDEELEKRIFLVVDKYCPNRLSLGIKSFPHGAVVLEDESKCLSLIDKFDGRNIKDGYNWNNDIFETMNEFLHTNTNIKDAYQIFLDTHASIAFAAGRILNSKTGINIFPMQKTVTSGTVLWDVTPLSKRKYSNWDISQEKFDENQYDSALILNVTRNIYNDVVNYIKESNLPIGRIINCTLNEIDATNFSIEDGNHAMSLANFVYDAIDQRTVDERKATLHIFVSAPNALMFFLGQNSVGFGKCVLYEYDFEQRASCSYTPSIYFTN